MLRHLGLQNFAIYTFHSNAIGNPCDAYIRMRCQRFPMQKITSLIRRLGQPQPQLAPQIGNAAPRPNDQLLPLSHASPPLIGSRNIDITRLWSLLTVMIIMKLTR